MKLFSAKDRGISARAVEYSSFPTLGNAKHKKIEVTIMKLTHIQTFLKTPAAGTEDCLS